VVTLRFSTCNDHISGRYPHFRGTKEFWGQICANAWEQPLSEPSQNEDRRAAKSEAWLARGRVMAGMCIRAARTERVDAVASCCGIILSSSLLDIANNASPTPSLRLPPELHHIIIHQLYISLSSSSSISSSSKPIFEAKAYFLQLQTSAATFSCRKYYDATDLDNCALLCREWRD
jgi:hypothetical protein